MLRSLLWVFVQILGLIENMSYFMCPHCGERSEIFSHGGARTTAKAMDLEFLGEVSDAGSYTSSATSSSSATAPAALAAGAALNCTHMY